jgi:hypothetical protein
MIARVSNLIGIVTQAPQHFSQPISALPFLFGPLPFLFGPLSFLFGPLPFLFGQLTFLFRQLTFMDGSFTRSRNPIVLLVKPAHP